MLMSRKYISPIRSIVQVSGITFATQQNVEVSTHPFFKLPQLPILSQCVNVPAYIQELMPETFVLFFSFCFSFSTTTTFSVSPCPLHSSSTVLLVLHFQLYYLGPRYHHGWNSLWTVLQASILSPVNIFSRAIILISSKYKPGWDTSIAPLNIFPLCTLNKIQPLHTVLNSFNACFQPRWPFWSLKCQARPHVRASAQNALPTSPPPPTLYITSF